MRAEPAGAPAGSPAGSPGAWPGAFEGLEVPVRCGPQRHRLRLEGERLVPADHGEDLSLERALAAVAGVPCPCLEIVEAWDLGDERPVELPPALRVAARARAVHDLADGDRSRRDGSLLRAIATEELQRLAESGRQLAGLDRTAGAVVTVSLAAAGPAEVTGRADSSGVRVRARLAREWWATVWRPGLVGGPQRFCLRAGGDGVEPTFVAWAQDGDGRAALRPVAGPAAHAGAVPGLGRPSGGGRPATV